MKESSVTTFSVLYRTSPKLLTFKLLPFFYGYHVFFMWVLGLSKTIEVPCQTSGYQEQHTTCAVSSPDDSLTLKVTTNLINTFPAIRHRASTFLSHEPLPSDNNWSCSLLLWVERYSQTRKADRLAWNDSILFSEFSGTYLYCPRIGIISTCIKCTHSNTVDNNTGYLVTRD